MNLWFRLAWLLMTRAFRAAPGLSAGEYRLVFRVLPFDLDPSLHMNNSRYLAFMDLGRIDLILGSGLWRAAARHGWTPIASSIAIRFRRELRLFDRFRLDTRLVAWDETAVVIEQVFVLDRGLRAGEIAARALFKGGLYDRRAKRFIPIARLMGETGVSAESPPVTPEVAAFLATDEALKRAGRVPR